MKIPIVGPDAPKTAGEGGGASKGVLTTQKLLTKFHPTATVTDIGKVFKEAVVCVAPGLLPGDQLNHTQGTQVLTLVLNEGFLYNPNGGGENEVKKILKNFGIERSDPLALNFVIGALVAVLGTSTASRERLTQAIQRGQTEKEDFETFVDGMLRMFEGVSIVSQHEKATYLASALWPGLTATAISMQLKMDGADSFGEEIRNHKEFSFLVQQSWMAIAKSNGEEGPPSVWTTAAQKLRHLAKYEKLNSLQLLRNRKKIRHRRKSNGQRSTILQKRRPSINGATRVNENTRWGNAKLLQKPIKQDKHQAKKTVPTRGTQQVRETKTRRGVPRRAPTPDCLTSFPLSLKTYQ